MKHFITCFISLIVVLIDIVGLDLNSRIKAKYLSRHYIVLDFQDDLDAVFHLASSRLDVLPPNFEKVKRLQRIVRPTGWVRYSIALCIHLNCFIHMQAIVINV